MRQRYLRSESGVLVPIEVSYSESNDHGLIFRTYDFRERIIEGPITNFRDVGYVTMSRPVPMPTPDRVYRQGVFVAMVQNYRRSGLKGVGVHAIDLAVELSKNTGLEGRVSLQTAWGSDPTWKRLGFESVEDTGLMYLSEKNSGISAAVINNCFTPYVPIGQRFLSRLKRLVRRE